MSVLKYNNNLILSDNKLQSFDGINPQGSIEIDSLQLTNVNAYNEAYIDGTNIIPENIVKGNTILGVQGNFVPGIVPLDEEYQMTNLTSQNITNYKYARINKENRDKIIASNIRQGVSILGVTGTYNKENPSFQIKNITPSTSTQTITKDSGYDGLTQVNLSAIPYTETLNDAGGYTVTIL